MIRILVIWLLLIGVQNFGQQIPVFSGIELNQYVYNPAYAGSRSYLEAHLKQRLQYVGVDYAPNTQFLSVHSSIAERNFGLGGYIYHETNGVLGKVQGMGTYAYHFSLSEYTTMSFGLSLGVNQFRTLAERMILDSDIDPLLNIQTNQRQSFFNSHAGMVIQNDYFYVGFSTLNTFSSRYRLYEQSTLPQVAHFNVNYGLNFYSGSAGMITLSGRNVFAKGLPVWSQFGFLYDYDEKFFGGVHYRWGDALIMMIGGKVWDELRLYYSYDLGVGAYRNTNAGSHEISLIYHFHYNPNISKDKARYSKKPVRGWKLSFKRKPKVISDP